MVSLEALVGLAQRYLGKGLGVPEPLKGDGSDRQIYRFRRGNDSWIGVTHADRAENEAFVVLSEHFKTCGLPVPTIYTQDLENGCYLLEDLGDVVLADLLSEWNQETPINREAIVQAYRKVLFWLPRMQIEAHQGLDYSFCYKETVLDASVFQWDLNYFRDYFWNLYAPNTPLTSAIADELNRLPHRLGRVPQQAFVSRDFQSRNIMWKQGEPYFIDYQSGCCGAIHYDLASLLYASRSGLNDALREQLIPIYLQELSPWISVSLTEFLDDFYHFVLIRRLRSFRHLWLFALTKRQTLFFRSDSRHDSRSVWLAHPTTRLKTVDGVAGIV